ncbi:recombinase RecT [Desulfovibrio sp. QI0442]
MSTALNLAKPQAPAQREHKSFSDLVRAKVSSVLVGKKADDFVTSLVSLMNQDPALKNCTPMSLISAALQAQSLNLSLNKVLGQAWVVPFKDKKISEINPATGEPFLMASFQIGYKGYLQLAIRSGQYRKINVLSIKDGELLQYDPLNEELHTDLIQDDTIREETPTIGYYAMFEYMNGFRKTMYWSKAKMAAHADRFSPAFSLKAKGGRYPKVSFADFEAGKVNERDMWLYSSFWYKDFDGMAYKTMLRQILSKWGIMSVEMQQAYIADMHAVNEGGVTSDIVDAEYSEGDDSKAELPPAAPGEHIDMDTGEVTPKEPVPARAKAPVQAQPPVQKEERAVPTEPAPQPQQQNSQNPNAFPCPRTDGATMVTEADCEKCNQRTRCPEWAVDLPEEG